MIKVYNQPLFPNANTFPSFFDENLVDDNRVIKVLTGQSASFRAFYYQLLKLSYEIENDSEDESKINYELMVKQSIQNFLSQIDNEDQRLQLQKSHALIESFLELLKRTEGSFEDYIEEHTEIDSAFIVILRAMTASSECQSTKQKFAILSDLFNVHISQYCDCVKFEQSDVFIFVENDQQLYLAFLNLVQAESEQQQSQENLSFWKGTESGKNKIGSETNKQKNDTIMNIFGDMLASKNQEVATNSFIHNLNNSHHQSGKKEGNRYQNFSIQEEVEAEGTNLEAPIIKEQESRTQNYLITQEQKTQIPTNIAPIAIISPLPENNERDSGQQEIFYKPKSKISQSDLVSKNNGSRIKRKDPLDVEDSHEKGTFYRQFTETKILNLLPEPQRSKVKMMKNRFIGVHSYHPKKI